MPVELGNSVGAGDNNVPNNNRRRNRANNPAYRLLNMHGRLLRALFFEAGLAYARKFPQPLRRLIELVVLLQAIIAFLLLVYIHIAFARTTNTCLESVRDSWPRDGILRVEILVGKSQYQDFPMNETYTREKTYFTSTFSSGIERGEFTHLQPSALVEIPKYIRLNAKVGTLGVNTTPTPSADNDLTTSLLIYSSTLDSGKVFHQSSSTSAIRERKREEQRQILVSSEVKGSEEFKTEFVPTPQIETIICSKDMYAHEIIFPQNDTESEIENLLKAEDVYIMEYALQYGFLYLPLVTRCRLNIPIMVVTLNTWQDQCFGNAFNNFLLNQFIGYDDLLMNSIKTLAESEDNKGYTRNLMTGQSYYFHNMNMGFTSYISSLFVMFVFTVIISMLLRCIFIYFLDLFHMLEINFTITSPFPLLTVLIALVSMEAVMSEFFDNSTTAIYVTMTVLVADLYNALCCNTPISKRYWFRFFYLYHFSFYAYSYRFNNGYSELALIVSWLFIQHSMIYFFHHYELPLILNQARMQQLLSQTQATPFTNNAINEGLSPPVVPTPTIMVHNSTTSRLIQVTFQSASGNSTSATSRNSTEPSSQTT